MIFNNKRKIWGFLSGLLLFIAVQVFPAPEELSPAAWNTAAVGLLMAAWWLTEAIPIAATALVPIVLFPILEVLDISSTLAPYAHPLIFLFLGGFIIAIAMEKWELHRRIALSIVRFVGTNPSSIILGFMLASAFLSMWVSNTATALMMLPIALSVITLIHRRENVDESTVHHFEVVLLLGVAYGCNIGGIGTLIGTPPNALLAGFMADNYGIEISFVRWMFLGVPLVALSLPLIFIVLTKWVYPLKLTELSGGRSLIDRQLKEVGGFSSAEKKVAAVFVVTALLWITRPLLSRWIPGLSDTGIAIAAALSFFLLPAGSGAREFMLEWSDVEELPWGILILFGGGLSLASAISETGLAGWIGSGVEGLQHWPVIFLVFLAAALIIVMTEITSNTATAAAFLPILGSIAVGVGRDPLLLAVPAALAASCAFMLPVATPPNAIIYGSKRLNIPEMARAGIWLNILFMFLITLTAYLFVPLVFEI